MPVYVNYGCLPEDPLDRCTAGAAGSMIQTVITNPELVSSISMSFTELQSALLQTSISLGCFPGK